MSVQPLTLKGSSGNIVANGTAIAAAATAVSFGSVIDLTSSTYQSWEGNIILSGVFTTVAGTAGLVLGMFTVSAAGVSSSPAFEIPLTAVGSSTQITVTTPMRPGCMYQPKITNLDQTNGATGGLTLDIIQSVG